MKSTAPLYLLAAVLMLAALFWWFKPDPAATDGVPAAAAPAPVVVAEPSAPVAAPPPLSVRFTIAKGVRVGEPQRLRVSQGSPVRFEILSDELAELHLHGYDHERPVPPGEVTRLDFTADLAGRFEIEAHLHSGHVELGVIEVMPH